MNSEIKKAEEEYYSKINGIQILMPLFKEIYNKKELLISNGISVSIKGKVIF